MKSAATKYYNFNFFEYSRSSANFLLGIMYLSNTVSVSGSTDKHTKLEIDLIEITKYIYLTLILCFNSRTLLHSSHASIQLSTAHLPDHISFFVTMLALNCSRIHLSHSFFLLPWNISDHTTPLLYSYSRHTHLSIQTSCIFTHLWQPLPQSPPLVP